MKDYERSNEFKALEDNYTKGFETNKDNDKERPAWGLDDEDNDEEALVRDLEKASQRSLMRVLLAVDFNLDRFKDTFSFKRATAKQIAILKAQIDGNLNVS